MALVKVADGLYPQSDYSFLPADVLAWAGYVGKPSINAWTPAQVAHLEQTGRVWLPIWTPGDGVDYTRAEAASDAAAMLAGLHTLGLHDGRGVFLDIERSREVNDVPQCEDAAGYWCSILRASGYPLAGWYGPWGSSAQWLANWTGTPPTSLPPGVWGIQYDHALANDRYDVSVFDSAVLGGRMSLNGPASWDAADWAAVVAQLPALAPYDPTHPGLASVATVLHVLVGVRDGASGFESLPVEDAKLTSIAGQLGKLVAGQPAPPTYKGTANIELTAGA